MRATELRIGNLLNYHTAEGEVLPTVIDWQDLKWISEDPKGFNLVHSPIPLTEEILLKCGYATCSFRDNHFVIKGHTIWKCNDLFICDKNGIVLKYLHQLQNLYHALTGEELTVNF